MVGMEFALHGPAQRITGPLAAAAMMLNVSRPGEEPASLAEANEDTRLLFGGAALKGV